VRLQLLLLVLLLLLLLLVVGGVLVRVVVLVVLGRGAGARGGGGILNASKWRGCAKNDARVFKFCRLCVLAGAGHNIVT
jgi:hypothetical protein